MANDIAPAFVRLNYHSLYGTHSATIPTLAWLNTVAPGGAGEFETHSGSSVDADSMINDLVDGLSGIYPTTSTFDNYIIFTVPAPGAAPQPRVSKILDVDGTLGTPGWTKAVQVTMNWRTTGFNLFKLVSLDCGSSNNFDRATVIAGGSLAAIDALVTSNVLGWAGRDNNRPATFVSQTVDLNDALRQRYRMA